MKKVFIMLLLLETAVLQAREYPVLETSDTLIANAYELALMTVEGNIKDGIIKAGGDYGGEWTRDASINAWNAGSLIFPEETYTSLMSVTEGDCERIGHQYWDKIIWVRGAYNHHLVTGCPLEKIYACCTCTMEELEGSVFDKESGLFKGPSVFNDGISGYEYPVPDVPTVKSNVLYNANTENIKCLSTNCIYYMAYRDLAEMAAVNGNFLRSVSYGAKARRLRKAIRKTFYDKPAGRLYYLVDHNGDTHRFQEALGCSFAILAGIVSKREAVSIARNVHISEFGIPSIWPDFERFEAERPGRHNNIVWPFVNAFWASAALQCGLEDKFGFELKNLADLAVNKGEGMFYEIYNPYTGLPDGGWQLDHHWTSCRDQTWSATGFLRMILEGVFGISFSEKGMTVSPASDVAARFGISAISGIRYRDCVVNVRVLPASDNPAGCYVNGKKVRAIRIPADARGTFDVIFRYSGSR